MKKSNIIFYNWVKTVEEIKKDYEQSLKNPIIPLDGKFHEVIKDKSGNISVDGKRIWKYDDLK